MPDPAFDALGEPPDPAGRVAAAALDDINRRHRADVLFVGRVLGGVPDATEAEAVGIDRSGVDLRVRHPAGHTTMRVPFLCEATDLSSLRMQVLGLASWACEACGRPPSVEAFPLGHEPAGGPVHDGGARAVVAEVVATRPLTPRTVRVTVGGPGLDAFVPAGPGQFVCVLTPPPGCGRLTVDETFGWDQYERMPSPVRPHAAHYFVRAWRPFERELDVDVVLHGHGATAAWAARAAPGEEVGLWGPRSSFQPPAGVDRYVLVADETALGGVATVLDALPPSAPVTVVAAVPDDDERVELPATPATEVTWLRSGPTPAALGRLLDALGTPDPGRTYVWGGGEGSGMERVRSHLRRARFALDHVMLSATWWSPPARSGPAGGAGRDGRDGAD